jgi:hypothetical protein
MRKIGDFTEDNREAVLQQAARKTPALDALFPVFSNA